MPKKKVAKKTIAPVKKAESLPLYRVLSANDPIALERKVAYYAELGYEPVGGINVVLPDYGALRGVLEEKVPEFFQAVKRG